MEKKFIKASEKFCYFEQHVPAPYLRKSFILDFVPEKATVDISGLGFYVLYINGKDITKGHLAPYISNLDHICYYDTYDVSPYLQEGENVIGVMLGNGFRNAFGGVVWDFDKVDFRGAPCLALEFSAQKGEKSLSFHADESFLCHPSPVIFDELRMGEHYDASLEIEGWNLPGFAVDGWTPALRTEPPRGRMKRCEAEPIAVLKELAPVSVNKRKDGWLYDFGENNAGICRLCLKNAEAGQRLELWHAEMLDENGELDISSTIFDRPDTQFYKTYSQKNVYIAKGAPEEIHVPEFTYQGFRYVFVTGLRDDQATKELLTYQVMSSGFDEIGGFSSSSGTLNTLFEMAKRSDRSNFYYFPTDCPHREKNGWTGDASMSAAHMSLLYDVDSSYREWLHNICAAQRADGSLPGIVPTGDWGYEWGNGPAWDSVLFNLPYELYKKRGDLDVIRENKSAMMRYLTYAMSRRSADGTIAIGLGDWVPVGRESDDYVAPLALTDTVMVISCARRASEMFDAIGSRTEADYARGIYRELRAAVRACLIDFDSMTAAGNCQTSQAMCIYYDVFDENEKKAAFEKLLALIHENDDRFDSGYLGLSVIFHVLSEFGEGELAYYMITRPGYPSYANLIERGETTLTEHFMPTDGEVGSHNHHFLGDIARWFVERVAGLRIIDSAHVEIAPDYLQELDFASAWHELPGGRVSVSWRREDGDIKLEVDCPEGISCKVIRK